LRPYQVDGYRWITRLAHWAKGACLADDMGLGKTLQALTFIVSRAERGPTLVIAPTSVVPNWQREAARFAPTLDVRRALQGVALDPALADLGPGDVLVTSWDLLVRHERLHLGPRGQEGPPWATVVLDEAHAMKNPTTRRAQAARALRADFVLALTGTPVENRPYELWSLMSVVAPGLLGSAETFREQFGRDIELRTPEASARLARIVRPFMLRRSKGQVATDLPAKAEVRVDVMLNGDERDRYQRVRKSAIRELDALGNAIGGQQGFIRILAVLTRLRQIACHPRLVDPKAPVTSSKVERLLELAEELRGEGRKMLVFSQFTELLKLVAAAFQQHGITCAYLDGSTPGEERVAAVDRFQSGAVDAFLLSLKAGGVGLNLTTATEVIHLDPWWNPAVEDQASDRAHRIGQDKPVTVYRLVANGTIEEQILGMHADKREMVSSLLEGTDSARPVSAEEMMALLMGEAAEVADVELAEPEALFPPLSPSTLAEPDLATVEPTRDAPPLRAPLTSPMPTIPADAAPPASATPPRVRAASARPTSESDSHIVTIVALMEREPERRLKRSALQETLGLDDAGWANLRPKLASHPRILVEGERRGTTYRLRSEPTT
jgi:SNF2 family DNA or RNA helicase